MLTREKGKVGAAALGREQGRGAKGSTQPGASGAARREVHPSGTAASVNKAQNELYIPFLGAVLSPGGVCV